MSKPLPETRHGKPVPKEVRFCLFIVAGAILAWLFNEPTGVALGKSFIEPLGLFNAKPDEKAPKVAAPQPAAPQGAPPEANEADEMAKEKAAEEERAKNRRSGQSTVLTSSLSFSGDDEEDTKRPTRKTALGAGA